LLSRSLHTVAPLSQLIKVESTQLPTKAIVPKAAAGMDCFDSQHLIIKDEAVTAEVVAVTHDSSGNTDQAVLLMLVATSMLRTLEHDRRNQLVSSNR
jgi:hypothetical protein